MRALQRQGSRLGASSSNSARMPNLCSSRRRQQCRQQHACRSGYYMQAPAAAASPVDKLLEGFWEVRVCVLRRLLLLAVDGAERAMLVRHQLSLYCRPSRLKTVQLHPFQPSQMQQCAIGRDSQHWAAKLPLHLCHVEAAMVLISGPFAIHVEAAGCLAGAALSRHCDATKHMCV
jgi:hypothetical protein